jgi:hypothetical protein
LHAWGRSYDANVLSNLHRFLFWRFRPRRHPRYRLRLKRRIIGRFKAVVAENPVLRNYVSSLFIWRPDINIPFPDNLVTVRLRCAHFGDDFFDGWDDCILSLRVGYENKIAAGGKRGETWLQLMKPVVVEGGRSIDVDLPSFETFPLQSHGGPYIRQVRIVGRRDRFRLADYTSRMPSRDVLAGSPGR